MVDLEAAPAVTTNNKSRSAWLSARKVVLEVAVMQTTATTEPTSSI